MVLRSDNLPISQIQRENLHGQEVITFTLTGAKTDYCLDFQNQINVTSQVVRFPYGIYLSSVSGDFSVKHSTVDAEADDAEDDGTGKYEWQCPHKNLHGVGGVFTQKIYITQGDTRVYKMILIGN